MNTIIKNTDLTLTECQALYWDQDAIAVTPIQLRRLDSRGMRKYFTIKDNRVDEVFTSVTSFAKAVMPTGEGLINWMRDKTPEQQEDILNQSSHYGTLLDILCNELLRDGSIEEVSGTVRNYIMHNTLYHVNIDKWTNQIKKDLLSFIEFVKDYQIKPIATSVAMRLPNTRLAGTCDLICEMNSKIPTKTDEKKGILPERIMAVVDYKAKIGDFLGKSERNSFYDSEALQLHCYKMMVEETMGINIQAIGNWSPKNWRTNPDYNFKRWDDTVVYQRIVAKFDHYYSIFVCDHPDDSATVQVISDTISITGENMKTSDRIDIINEALSTQSVDMQLEDVLAPDLDSLLEDRS